MFLIEYNGEGETAKAWGRQYNARKRALEENMKKLYSVIWGHCNELMRRRIQALQEYKKINSDADSLALLKSIRTRL